MPDGEWIRKLCLSFPDATENLQWGETLCFKVRGKLFATMHISEGKLASVVFKCAPEKFHELVEIEGISPAPYVGRYKWVLLESCHVLPSSELEALIRQSYDMVVAKTPTKKASLLKPHPNAARSNRVSPVPSVPPVVKAFLGTLGISAVNPFDSPQPPKLASYFRPISCAFNIVL